MPKTKTTKHQPHCRAPQGYVCCCVNKDEVIEVGSIMGEDADCYNHGDDDED